MDWPESTQPLIVGFPRGRQRDGNEPAGLIDDANPLRWTSRYASLVTTIYGVGTVDGLNEAGLAGHGLYLEATDFGPRDPAKPAMHAGLWLQYLLDQAATVAEAVALMADFELISSPCADTTPISISLSRMPAATRPSSSSHRAVRPSITAGSTP